MSKKQWLVLLMLFLTYLLLGASIFYQIESQLEIERVEKARHERIEINALLNEHYASSSDFNQILGKLTEYCGKSFSNRTDAEVDSYKWDFYNSFYFAYTVVSTIGYGNLAPTNMLSRILMIFYGLIGIPMNGILLTQLGEFFSRVFVKAHEKYKSYKRNHNDYYPKKLAKFETGKVGLAAQILVHLVPGFVMFIFFPAFLFSYYEGWSYDASVYYAFVTLTTIGFGDYVAGQDNSKGNGFQFVLYKTFLICWISFGLGYTVMIMTFIARGMRSKRIARIEHKLAVNLKHTQSKIWNEFNKEIDYLRRVFNELQLSKVKRVYVDECNYEIPRSKFAARSNSFPDLRDLLYGLKEKEVPCYKPRRRANSEMVPTEDQVPRVVSETDLQRIDKTATFASHAMVQPAELLARFVNILGYIPPTTDAETGNGLNQAEPTPVTDTINKSNGAGGVWTIGSEKIPRFARPRSRAASEIRLRETRNEDQNIERTWSGPIAARKAAELIKVQQASEESSGKESKFSKLRGFASTWRTRLSQIQSGSRGDREVNDNDTRQSFGRHYYTHTGASGNHLNLNDTESSNLLEETSLADFLRALTVLHASVATNGNWSSIPVDQYRTEELKDPPRRKMGTASLTPPKLPSLFTLFSPSMPVSPNQSNENTITRFESKSRPRRLSELPRTKPRRFSLRPVPTPISPPTPPRNNSLFLSNSRRTSVANKSSFLFESPKVPLIQTEGTPGLSSPIQSVNERRLSLRSTQTQNQATSAPALKAVPRWKAGMLQRQINQMNLRRRVRAFSLSDVYTDDPNERTETVLPSFYKAKNNRDAVNENVAPLQRRNADGEQQTSSTNSNPIERFASSKDSRSERQSFSDRPPVPDSHHVDMEFQQPLMEIKIEKPDENSRS